MSYCASCLEIATHKCSICTHIFCEKCAKKHLKFWLLDNPNVTLIKLEEPPDAKTL